MGIRASGEKVDVSIFLMGFACFCLGTVTVYGYLWYLFKCIKGT